MILLFLQLFLTPVRAINDVQIDHISGFVQWSKRTTLGNSDLWLNAGLRAHNWTVAGKGLTSNTQTVFSPRAHLIKTRLGS